MITALVSGYYSEEWIETRLINLRQQDCEIILVCQSGSVEQEIGLQYGLKPILTYDVPSLYAAWNMAIKQSTGDFLVVANTDDRFYTGALEKMHSRLVATGADICYSDYDITNGKNIMRKEGRHHRASDIFTTCFIGPMPMWRKSLHERVGMFDESFIIAGDWEFWIRCVKGGAQLSYLPESIGMYRNRPLSLEHKNKEVHGRERKRIKAMMK